MSQNFSSIEEFHDHIRNKSVEDSGFRSRLLADPKSVVEEELGMSIPDGFNVKVHEEGSSTAHLVLPPSAALADSEMQSVAGGSADDHVNWGWCSPV